MINALYDILKNDKELSDFKINYTYKTSGEVFFVFDKIETKRVTNTLDINVTIFLLHDSKLGLKSFNVSPAATKEEILEKIEEAKNVARYVFNEVYTLPENINSDDDLDYIFKDEKLIDVAKNVGLELLKVKTSAGAGINALEVFASNVERGVISSKNVNRKSRSSNLFIEAIPTFTTKEESVELYEDIDTTELDYAKLKQEIKDKLEEVENRYNALKPATKLDLRVAFRAKELEQLFDGLSYDISYGSVFNKQNVYKLGDKIQKNPKYDKVNLTLRGSVPGLSNSRLFDQDGLTLKDTKVFSDGEVKNYFGNKRYADYLGYEATGYLPCMELECGSLDIDNFDEPYLECVSLSGLQFDPSTDYIGGEVRLAYIHDKGEITPITGISVSAKFSDVINTVRFSKQDTKTASLHGPKLALFEGFNIN